MYKCLNIIYNHYIITDYFIFSLDNITTFTPSNLMAKISSFKKVFRSDALNGLSILNPKRIMDNSARSKAFIALATVSIIWGTTWVASKYGTKYLSGLQLAAIRQILAGSLFLIYFTIKGATWPKRSDLQGLLILAFLNFVCSNGLSTWAMNYIPAGLGAILGVTYPLWLVIITIFTTKEYLPDKALIGLLLGFGGVCVIFADHLQDFLNPAFSFGILLSFIASWTWAFGTLYTKNHAKKFNPYFSLGFQMLIAGIALYVVSMLQPNYVAIQNLPIEAWYSIWYLVIFGSIIGFGSFLYSLEHLPMQQASIYAYINPIVAIFLGSIILGESVTIWVIIGSVITLYGVWLVNASFRKKER